MRVLLHLKPFEMLEWRVLKVKCSYSGVIMVRNHSFVIKPQI